MKTTPTPTQTPPDPPLSPTAASNQALQKAVEYAQEYGRMKEIAAELSKLTGQIVSRQMVGRWLKPDPEKRTQIGSFGMGLALLYVIAAMQANDGEEVAAEFEIVVTKPKSKKNPTKQ